MKNLKDYNILVELDIFLSENLKDLDYSMGAFLRSLSDDVKNELLACIRGIKNKMIAEKAKYTVEIIDQALKAESITDDKFKNLQKLHTDDLKNILRDFKYKLSQYKEPYMDIITETKTEKENT